MKKQSMIAMAILLGLAGSTALPTQAAGKNRVVNHVLSNNNCIIVNGQICDVSDVQSAFDKWCEQIQNVSNKNCPIVLLPDTDIPEQDNAGDNNNQPETDNEQPETDNEQPENNPENLSYAEQVVNLVNEERAKRGLSPVELDTEIASAALIRAQEIQTSFSHTRPDGRTFSTVLTDNGIRFMGAGENIAWGQTSPEQVMNAWMNSDGHRANILNANYTKIGVGHYQDVTGRQYWVQLFTY